MKSTAILPPEVIAIVDLSYADDVEHWLHTIRRLSNLPSDPTLCVQIRAKSVSPDDVKTTARLAREAFQNRQVTLSWNGDPHIATSCGFDGCHQPQVDISELDNETSHLIHSASVHDEVSLVQAERCGVDFVVFGPVFKPHWKKVQAQGIEELTRLATIASLPIVAIGGVNLNTVARISQTHACGVACLSSVMDALDPVEAVVMLQAQWRESMSARHAQ